MHSMKKICQFTRVLLSMRVSFDLLGLFLSIVWRYFREESTPTESIVIRTMTIYFTTDVNFRLVLF